MEATLFLICMVLIQLSTFTQLETADLVKTLVWLNLVLSSTLFCLLIRFQFAKETVTLFKKQERLLTQINTSERDRSFGTKTSGPF